MSRTTCPHGMVDTCCENYNNCNLGRQAIAEAEPVAWMYQCSADSSGPCFMQHKTNWAESGSGLWTETPLYIHPPKRDWVGLTDRDIEDLWGEDVSIMYSGHYDAIRAIEAKLKKKNGYTEEKNT